MDAYAVAVKITKVAESVARFDNVPEANLWLISSALERLEIPGDVFTLLTGNAQEINSVRDRPVTYWNMAYPNAHLIAYELWDRLLAHSWLIANELGLVPDLCCGDRFDFEVFHLSVLRGKERKIRRYFSEWPIPDPKALFAELALEVSKVARQRAEQFGRAGREQIVDEDSPYRPAKEFLDVAGITSHKRLISVLKNNPWIRRRKPSRQRLEIHAGDFMRFRSAAGSAAFDALDVSGETAEEFLAAARERQAVIRQRKAL